MKRNWEHTNWPYFIYDDQEFNHHERIFLERSGEQAGSIKHISEKEQIRLKIELLSNEAYKTSKIEGEHLDWDSLQSSVQRQFGLKNDNRRIEPAEQGISEMMVHLYQNFGEPLSSKTLFKWYTLLMSGRRDITTIGAYRTHEDPMQIVSGAYHKPKVHFEAPPSEKVSYEMENFIKWYNQSISQASCLLHAGIAHIYFESIHPFEDGNGRVGRAISEKALSQHLGRPTLISLSETIEKNKKNYYQALHDASITLEINEWLEFFNEIILEAQLRTQSKIDFLIEKGKYYALYAEKMNDRQLKVVKRVFDTGIDGFEGGLSAENYISITGTSRATATRDLQQLVKMSALKKKGERRYTRYFLNIVHPSVLV